MIDAIGPTGWIIIVAIAVIVVIVVGVYGLLRMSEKEPEQPISLDCDYLAGGESIDYIDAAAREAEHEAYLRQWALEGPGSGISGYYVTDGAIRFVPAGERP